MVENTKLLWKEILKNLEDRMTTPAFEMWIKPLGFKSFEDNTLYLVTNRTMQQDYVRKRYNLEILNALREVTQNPYSEFDIILDSKFKPKFTPQKPVPFDTTEVVQQKLPLDENPYERLKMTSFNLNLKYSFDNFIEGESNKFALGAAKSIARKPGTLYNPLFLYGGAGLGKTHLLHSIGHYILLNHHDKKVRYVTVEELTNEFVQIMVAYKGNEKKKNEFKNKYKNVDVLLIDDVQFLEGREKTQDELFNIFDHLHRNGKQIVITSDRPPKDISTLTDRLRSRFEWGLLAQITPPPYETRVEILKQKVKEENLSIPLSVLELIASVFKNNVRELEGALNRMSAFASIQNTAVTLETAKKIINFAAREKELTAEGIINYVGDYFNIEPSEIKASSRSKDIALARHIAVYLTRELVKSSFPQIGSVINRKHTTVLYSYEKTKEDYQTDKKVKYFIDEIIQKINDDFIV
ncbi:MAG: chromosomal replication initiator protein DnaA [Candidatus Gastranaerophilales bacterium]|nr:chromosomal replication initiator protein DnaA [Candidatus Gastranaerophilales bacterium]